MLLQTILLSFAVTTQADPDRHPKWDSPAHLSPVLLQSGRDNAKCMTASANEDTAVVKIQECVGSEAQQWSFVLQEAEADMPQGLHLKVFGDKCLDGSRQQNGAKLIIVDCSAPRWFPFAHFFEGQIFLSRSAVVVSDSVIRCVDVDLGITDDGRQLQIWDCMPGNPNQMWYAGYLESSAPIKSEEHQVGTNRCGTGSAPDSMCQTLLLMSPTDFCIPAPSQPGGIGQPGVDFVSWCSQDHGARKIPAGTLQDNRIAFHQSSEYIELFGSGDFSKLNIQPQDRFGLGARMYEGYTLPTGMLLFGDTFNPGQQYHEWVAYVNATRFCLRACQGQNGETKCASFTPQTDCNFPQ